MNLQSLVTPALSLVALVCLTVLMALGKVDSTAGVSLIAAIIGTHVGASISSPTTVVYPPSVPVGLAPPTGAGDTPPPAR